MAEDANNDQRDCGHDLDEDIQAGADGILQGIADGIADDGGVMRRRTLAGAFYAAGFNVLLAVVPRAAGITGEDRQHAGADDGADEQASNKLRHRR